jgi:dihydrofolate reductase
VVPSFSNGSSIRRRFARCTVRTADAWTLTTNSRFDRWATSGVHSRSQHVRSVRGPDEAWKGWWGDNSPYHAPVFVLTHHERKPLVVQEGTTFHFVTAGIDEAMRLAKAAAGEKDVKIGGGVCTVRQYLQAGLVGTVHFAVAPVVLGSGESLFAGLNLPPPWLFRHQSPCYRTDVAHCARERELKPVRIGIQRGLLPASPDSIWNARFPVARNVTGGDFFSIRLNC